jgi:hypothetical protein
MSYVVSTLHYYEFTMELMAHDTLVFFNQQSRLELYLYGGTNINIKQSEKFPSEYPSYNRGGYYAYSLRAGAGGIKCENTTLLRVCFQTLQNLRCVPL